jgi:hypothetical protein
MIPGIPNALDAIFPGFHGLNGKKATEAPCEAALNV